MEGGCGEKGCTPWNAPRCVILATLSFIPIFVAYHRQRPSKKRVHLALNYPHLGFPVTSSSAIMWFSLLLGVYGAVQVIWPTLGLIYHTRDLASHLETLERLCIRGLCMMIVGNVQDRLKRNPLKFLLQIIGYTVIFGAIFESCPRKSLATRSEEDPKNSSIAAAIAGWAAGVMVAVFALYNHIILARSQGLRYFRFYVGALLATAFAHALLFAFFSREVEIHIHHYHWSFILSCACCFPHPLSQWCQAMCIGIFLHGVAVFEFDPMFSQLPPGPVASFDAVEKLHYDQSSFLSAPTPSMP
mmetsp:Transcript_33274/g.53448  ORF Transcript_33274/g.53448 Transcript_33274/m.53448 type:complete len:301 (-) Transcript_33274:38-940(-)